MCCCFSSLGLESFVKVNIIVQDINDNKPELAVDDIFICENDNADMVRDIVTVFTVGYHLIWIYFFIYHISTDSLSALHHLKLSRLVI